MCPMLGICLTLTHEVVSAGSFRNRPQAAHSAASTFLKPSRGAPWTACHGVCSHADAVALVIGYSIPVGSKGRPPTIRARAKAHQPGMNVRPGRKILGSREP